MCRSGALESPAHQAKKGGSFCAKFSQNFQCFLSSMCNLCIELENLAAFLFFSQRTNLHHVYICINEM